KPRPRVRHRLLAWHHETVEDRGASLDRLTSRRRFRRQSPARRVRETRNWVWRTTMRGKVTSAGMAALGLILGLAVGSLNSGAQAEPLKIRGAWVAPISNFASIWLQKKDLAVHFRQSYVFESGRY